MKGLLGLLPPSHDEGTVGMFLPAWFLRCSATARPGQASGGPHSLRLGLQQQDSDRMALWDWVKPRPPAQGERTGVQHGTRLPALFTQVLLETPGP